MQRTRGGNGGSPSDDVKTEYTMKEGLIFLRNVYGSLTKPNLPFQDIFDNYNEYWESGTIFIDMKRARLIEDWLKPGSTMLDAGVGQGLISEYLMRKKNLKVFGFDISNAACEKARQRGIVAEVRDINNGLGLNKEEFYDYIQLSEVIEHTLYPQRILIDATRHARKGVIVTIPNAAYISYRIQLLRGYSPRQSFTHLHYWSVKDFELFCNALNIRILDFNTLLPRYLMRFRNLLATTQAWLLAPERAEN
jgi:methionine biosynthesis protein MetW